MVLRRMLDTYHLGHYRVYNLYLSLLVRLCIQEFSFVHKAFSSCSERSYSHSIFYNRVKEFPIDDHNVPTMTMIRQFCEDAVWELLLLDLLRLTTREGEGGLAPSKRCQCNRCSLQGWKGTNWSDDLLLANARQYMPRTA